jgi:hypothetical protein
MYYTQEPRLVFGSRRSHTDRFRGTSRYVGIEYMNRSKFLTTALKRSVGKVNSHTPCNGLRELQITLGSREASNRVIDLS